MGGEAVAELVGTDFEGDGGVAEVFLQEIIDGPHRDPAAEFAEEKGALLHSGGGAVVLDSAQSGAAHWADAVLAALAGNAQGFAERVDVVDVQFNQFVKPEAGAVEEFEDGCIALGSPGGGALGAIGFQGQRKRQEFLDLGEGQDHGEGALDFGKLDLEKWITGQARAVG